MTETRDAVFIGDSTIIRNLHALIRKVAPARTPVLVQGPTGVGKELVARALHDRSGRRGRYVAINMASLGEGTAESQLFGHVKGAFTGAHTDSAGLFAEASGGTVLLDEINSCPLAIQAKLLRVVERREVRRLGGRGEQEYDFRVVAATNADIEQLVRAQQFRADLLHRLEGVILHVPPLAAHLEDLPLLVRHFAGTIAVERKSPIQFSAAAITALSEYEWPGNVRELKHSVERIALLSDTPLIDESEVRAVLGWPMRSRVKVAHQSDREAMLALIKRHRKNIDAVAAALNVNRSTLYRRMRRLGVRTEMIELDEMPSV